MIQSLYPLRLYEQSLFLGVWEDLFNKPLFIYLFYSFILYTFINLSSHSIKRVYKCSCIKGLSLKMILPLSSQKGFYPPIFI